MLELFVNIVFNSIHKYEFDALLLFLHHSWIAEFYNLCLSSFW
jgi:hypothetical protein